MPTDADALTKQLASGTARQRREAALAAVQLGSGAAACAGALAQAAIADPSPPVREAAASALVAADEGGASVPLLLPALDGADATLGIRAAGVLGRLGPRAQAAAGALRAAAIAGRDGDLAAAAAEALGAVDAEGKELEAIATALAGPDASRTLALAALGSYGPRGGTALPGVLAVMDDPLEEVRRAAVLALVALDAGAAPAVPALVRALGDPAVRLIAIMALTRLGPLARSAAPSLGTLASDPEMGAAARAALAAIGDP